MPTMFDMYMGPNTAPNLTPQEAKELELRRQGATQQYRGPLRGEYIPKEASLGRQPTGLLGSDPVATQQQAGTRQAKPGRTFYTNSAGQTGTSVPKGAGTSGVYDVVPEAGGGGKGLLGRVAGALGSPAAAGAQAALYSSDADAPERDLPPTKEEVSDANKYAKRIQTMAKNAPIPLKPIDGSATPPKEMAPAEKAVVAQQQEKKRQVVEAQAKQELSSSKLSRTKAAEAVVKADCERKGIDPSPEEKKKMVAEEVSSMRTMNNDNLAKYISYAIMGLGVIAGGSSRENGQIWGANFRAGYDDVINRAAAERKFQAEQAQQKIENEQKERDLVRKEKDTDSSVEYRGILGDTSLGRLELDGEKFDFDKDYKGVRLGQFERGLGIERERLALYGSRVASQNKKDAEGDSTPLAPDMPQAVQMEIAEEELKERKIKASDAFVAQYAAEKRKIRKALPDATEDEISDLAFENVGKVAKDEISWFGYGSPTGKKEVRLKTAAEMSE